jgi:hypothetical protein
MTPKGMHITCAAQVYLRVGESVAAHAVGENDNGPGAGARSRRQLRLVDGGDPQVVRQHGPAQAEHGGEGVRGRCVQQLNGTYNEFQN